MRKISFFLVVAMLIGLFSVNVSATSEFAPLDNVMLTGDFDDLYAPGVTLTE